MGGERLRQRRGSQGPQGSQHNELVLYGAGLDAWEDLQSPEHAMFAVAVDENGNDLAYQGASAPSLESPLSLTERRQRNLTSPAILQNEVRNRGVSNASNYSYRARRNALAPGFQRQEPSSPQYTQREVEAYFQTVHDSDDSYSQYGTSTSASGDNERYFDASDTDASMMSDGDASPEARDDTLAFDWNAVPEITGKQSVMLFRQRVFYKCTPETPELGIIFHKLGDLLSQLVRSQFNLEKSLDFASLLRSRLATHFAASDKRIPAQLQEAANTLATSEANGHALEHFRHSRVAVKRLISQRGALHSQRLFMDRKLRKNKRYERYLAEFSNPNSCLPDTSTRTAHKVNKLRGIIDRYKEYEAEVEIKAKRLLAAAEKPPPAVAALQDAEFHLLHLFRVHLSQYQNRNPAGLELYGQLLNAFTKTMSLS